MYRIVLVLITIACAGRAAELRSDLAAGRAAYTAGEYRKAATHLERALKADPENAESHFWLGKSYELLATTGFPLFGGRSVEKARFHLTRAVDLDPYRRDYRDQLLHFLLHSSGSRASLNQAERMIGEDPSLAWQSSLVARERAERRSAQGVVAGAILFVPRQVLP